MFRSIDGAAHWTAVETLPSNAGIDAITVDPRFGSIVYTAVSGYGLYQSADGGLHWTLRAAPTEAYAPIVVDSKTSSVYAARFNCPVVSADLGASWAALACIRPLSRITDFLPDPGDPGTLYVSATQSLFRPAPALTPAQGGVFRSTDGGASFIDVTGNLPDAVYALRLAPDGSVLAGTESGLFVSRDRAASWEAVTTFPAVAVWTLVSGTGRSVLAGTSSRAFFASSDAGVTWESRSHGIRAAQIGAVSIDPRTPSTIWVGSADVGGGISLSLDGGATWRHVDGFPTDRSVEALAVDPRRSDRLFAGGSDRGGPSYLFSALLVTSDEGQTWRENLSAGFTRLDGFAFDPLESQRFFAGTGSALYESRDSGSNWSVVLSESRGSPVFDPGNPQRMYTTAHTSSDGGRSWTAMNLFGSVQTARSPVVAPSGAVMLGTKRGVWRSDDFGATFSPANAGIESRDVSAIAIDPRSGTMYAGLTDDPASAQPDLFESHDGLSWTPFAEGLPRSTVSVLAVDTTWGAVYAATLGGLYRRIPSGASCAGTEEFLCLGGRFRAQVSWTTGSEPASAKALPLTADAGAFWFFSSNNLELVVKVVDGTALNGRFWVFGAALTDVEYDLVVTDTTTGAVWTRHNPGGTLASFTDTPAF